MVDEAVDVPAKIEAAIRAVPVEPLKQVLDWIGPVREEHFELAWSKFMAGNVALQAWPDGNHRTSFMLLADLAWIYLEESVGMDASIMEAMLKESKRILQEHPSLPGNPVFSLEALSDSKHPYREMFARYAPLLQWESAS